MPHAQQLGRYHLLDRIAFGGMAEIFRAKTFDSDGQVHLVAVKRILRHLGEDQDVIQMLVDEAKVTAVLRNENIAQLYEFAREGQEYFLAMEYVDGKDVRAIIEKARQTGQRVPAEQAAWIVMETANALHVAHCQHDAAGRALRIVHRDVSPSNILCSYRGEVKLCDFGIAKATLTRIQTRTGVIKGKVKYMSPEQAMGRTLDHRSDLFSLGTVLYELLALQAPFLAATEVELIFAVREARKRPILELRPDVPASLVAILDRAMARPRSARYQSGEELARDLRGFLDGHVPGYRRGHFAQYMRDGFAGEIEAELRQLEGYVLEEPDVSRIGVNLIADVLGPDAPFTRFSPIQAALTLDVRFPVDSDGLYAQPTQLLSRSALGDGDERATAVGRDGAPGLDELATRMKVDMPARSLHQEETRLHAVPAELLDRLNAETAPRRARSIFEEPTAVKELADEGDSEAPDSQPDDHSSSEVVEVDTGLYAAEAVSDAGDLHQEETRIFRRSDVAAALSVPQPSEPVPSSEPWQPSQPAVADPGFDTLPGTNEAGLGGLADATHTYTGPIEEVDPDLDEEFALPLSDEDLEDVSEAE